MLLRPHPLHTINTAIVWASASLMKLPRIRRSLNHTPLSPVADGAWRVLFPVLLLNALKTVLKRR